MPSWKGTHYQSLQPGRCVAAAKHRLRDGRATTGTVQQRILALIRWPLWATEQAKEGSVGGSKAPLLQLLISATTFPIALQQSPHSPQTVASLSLYRNLLFKKFISKITTHYYTTTFQHCVKHCSGKLDKCSSYACTDMSDVDKQL